MYHEFIQRMIFKPVAALLKQGITPERLALSMACGITIGSFPIVGSTTVICTAIALAFRLNLPAILLGNWIVYPIQLVLIVPFIITGEHLFGSSTAINPQAFAAMFHSDMLNALRVMSGAVLHAAMAWAIVAPVAILAFYLILCPLFRAMVKLFDEQTAISR